MTGTQPERCKSSADTGIAIPEKPVEEKPCPKISSIEIVSSREPNGYQIEFRLKAIIEGGTPDSYSWSWLPDQKPVVTQGPEITVLLDRPEGRSIKCPINLAITGPDNCSDHAGVNVHVPPVIIEKPKIWCTLIPWLLAFLASLTLGALIVCYLAEDQNQLTEGQGLYMYSWLSVVTVLAMLCGFFWWYIGNRIGCPPDGFGGLAVCWSVLIHALILIFMVNQCFVESNWQLLAGIILVLAIASIYFWISKYREKISLTIIAVYVAAIILSLIFAFYLIAGPSLQCC